jgi:hypothetical protein
MWPEEEKKRVIAEASVVKQKFTSGAEIYKWSNDLQVEQRFTSGADIYKWSRNLQVEQ